MNGSRNVHSLGRNGHGKGAGIEFETGGRASGGGDIAPDIDDIGDVGDTGDVNMEAG